MNIWQSKLENNILSDFKCQKHNRITVGASEVLTLMKIKHKLRKKIGKQ